MLAGGLAQEVHVGVEHCLAVAPALEVPAAPVDVDDTSPGGTDQEVADEVGLSLAASPAQFSCLPEGSDIQLCAKDTKQERKAFQSARSSQNL